MTISPLEVSFLLPRTDFAYAIDFLQFLRKAGQKHSVTISVSTNGKKGLALSVPGTERCNFNMFLQDIMLTQGLYYYLCTVSNRRYVARAIVKPIIEELLISCFSIVYPVLVRKHLLQGSPVWTPGEFTDEIARKYEVLFQRFQLKMTSGYEFIRDVDDLLTEFMLINLGHAKGAKSPNFGDLVSRCGRRNILRGDRVTELFRKIHFLRTRGLHRLEREIPQADLTEIAQSVYNVFEWVNDYGNAQDAKTVVLSGRRYHRIRYGKEIRYSRRHRTEWLSTEPQKRWVEIVKQPCHDCDVIAGELHLDGCDVEECPRCRRQCLCCDCRGTEDDEC